MGAENRVWAKHLWDFPLETYGTPGLQSLLESCRSSADIPKFLKNDKDFIERKQDAEQAIEWIEAELARRDAILNSPDPLVRRSIGSDGLPFEEDDEDEPYFSEDDDDELD